ncbi:hypothetical protein CBS101457_001670 [Exobasidium rhododendri]|nr:hypothetical protein CBS101457_001670 [Exobasidium rhododendri]
MSYLLSPLKAQLTRVETLLDDDKIPWMITIQGLLMAVLSFELLVSLRQRKTYNYPAPPPQLKAHVDQETYIKSRNYGKDKLNFSLFTLIFEWALSATLIYFGAYVRIWEAAGIVMTKMGYETDSEIPHSLLFLLLSQPITSIPTLPLSLYRHFVLEEKHGFNKMTLATFFLDGVKEWAVGVVIAGPLMAGLIKLIRWAGDGFVAYVAVFMFAFQILAMVLYPTLIQPLFNKLTPLPEGELKDRVYALAKQLNFPLKNIYVIDGSKRSAHSNAYFYGVLPNAKYICIYDTLMEKSTPDEVEAILAHELGHWAHSDPTKLLVLSQVQIITIMSLFTLFIHNASLFRAFGFNYVPPTVGVQVAYLPVVVGLELFQLVLHPLDSLVKFGMNAAVRKMEFAADDFAARQPRAPALPTKESSISEVVEQEEYSSLLSKSLIKIHIQNLSTMHHDALYSAYHYSHPTLTERLTALEKVDASTKKTR